MRITDLVKRFLERKKVEPKDLGYFLLLRVPLVAKCVFGMSAN